MGTNFPDVVLRPGGGKRCRVVYSYSPQNEDELSLQEKDEIEFISEVEEGWWRGRLNGKTGVFPSNFVVELPPAPVEEPCLSEGDVSAPLSSPEEAVPVLPPKPVREQCRVIFSYDAQVEDELTLVKDDIVTIINKDVEDKGWWKGELRGKIGLFPDNFVQIISPSDEFVNNQQKKPDRPAKSIPAEPKVDTKIPLPALANKKLEKIEAETTNNNESAAKRKSADLGLIKPDTVASHRKSLEEKVANEVLVPAGKKPPLRPPVGGKPKPTASGKPTSVKRLSTEFSDLVDGALSSKLNSRLKSMESVEPTEDLDLDVVGRSDMLSHITASRPRAPGRRPPSSTSSNKENEGSSPLTNGTSDGIKLDKSPKEKPKQHLPFMDELKVNLKSNKPPIDTGANLDKKASLGLWGSKVGSQTNLETSSANSTSSSTHSHDVIHIKSTSSDVKTSSDITKSSTAISAASSFRTFEKAESISSKVSELSSVFDERNKVIPSVSDIPNHDGSSKKEVADLRLKVEKLERTVAELAAQLKDEAEKRRQIEKELLKLIDLVTQV